MMISEILTLPLPFRSPAAPASAWFWVTVLGVTNCVLRLIKRWEYFYMLIRLLLLLLLLLFGGLAKFAASGEVGGIMGFGKFSSESWWMEEMRVYE